MMGLPFPWSGVAISRVADGTNDPATNEPTDVARELADARCCLAAYLERTLPLRIVTTMSAGCWIVTILVLTGVLGDMWFSLPCLLVSISLWGLTILEFQRTHRRLCPERADFRRRHVLQLLVSPFGTVRCLEKVSRNLFAPFSALVLLGTLGTEHELRRELRRRLREVRRAKAASLPTDSADGAKEPGPAEELRAIMAALAITEADLDAPDRHDPGALSYCPCCQGQYCQEQYGDSAVLCPHCGDLPLRPLAAPADCGEPAPGELSATPK